jgi:undecaprenyl pyrophosphate phosphatase UppP
MLEATIRNFLRSHGMASGFGAELALAVMALALLGTGERGTDVALQLTARLSFLLFLPAYCGSALAALFGPPFDLIKQRARDFGLAFASAHLVHLGLVVWLCYIGAAPGLTTFVFFGIAAMWTYLLALLSIERLHRAVSRQVWRGLNLVGLNFIALAFAVDFLRFPFQADAKYLVGYLPFVILAIAGPVLRVAAWGLHVYQSWRNSTSPAH